MSVNRIRSVLIATVAVLFIGTSHAWAIKPYTLVEDGYAEAQGTLELENTFETFWHPKSNVHFKSFSMEHELEYAPTDNLNLRVKGAYAYESGADFTGFHFDGAAFEVQYYFTNPLSSPIGLSVIGSAGIGERGFGSFEGFFVAQKDFEAFTITYNLGFVTEIDNLYRGGSKETAGTLVNALGAVFNVGKRIRLGGEISAESGYDEWRKYTSTVIYAGPVINWTPTPNLWISAGIDYQISGHRDEPQYRASVIVGYYF